MQSSDKEEMIEHTAQRLGIKALELDSRYHTHGDGKYSSILMMFESFVELKATQFGSWSIRLL